MWKTYAAACSITLLAAALLFSPQTGLKAAVYGMDIWWKTVFPSLLPFLILTELMIGLGVIAFFGSILSGLMRFFFRIPGPAGVTWMLSLASGFPAGARMAAQLRTEQSITRTEAERLVAMAHSSNPLFILSAVASGFLKSPETGLLLASAHYSGAFLVGLTMRFYGKEEKIERKKIKTAGPLQTFKEAREKDGRVFGTLLADAVLSSVKTLVLVGGFILFFSVLTTLLHKYGVAAFLFSLLGSNETSMPVFKALFAGFFELTSGVQLSSSGSIPLPVSLLLISAILGFSGLSVHAQVAAIISETDIRFGPFFAGRILHSVYAAVITFCLLSWPVSFPKAALSFAPEHGMLTTVVVLGVASLLLGVRYSKSRTKRV
ncbi:sporulation integral membrane protein YlbJ [Domibacillus sp. PGB-M46]|uniref:sporulation integral membrane protein YlbJ n=1 Tax=Domibacillus sp. PGB-M46 TaxID=2910255 RepID=UPI001F5AE29F|nr:sporulation integral membrane protein YlbJ [Domibacillus sp. PGB-M46]MCI2253213.1 sporulation integral membrane protein YlbJ [Domibacillus sp. PGB-M46]